MRVRVYRIRDGQRLVMIEPARSAHIPPVSFYAPDKETFKDMVRVEVDLVARAEARPFPPPTP